MFFEKDLLSVHLLEVLELKQEAVNMWNDGRNFNALSFRFHADNTHLKTETADHALSTNSVAYVPARLNYRRISAKDELIVIHFDTMNYQTASIEAFLPKNAEVLAALFRQILDTWNKKEPGYRYRCSAILYEILAECYAQNYIPKPQISKIQRSVDYLLANFRNSDLSIGEIAKQSFMSEVYFRRLFQETYGTSPKKYIVNLRIQNAVGLIATGYYSLGEVAYLSGYNDYKYFSVEFKRIKGVSPSEYLYNYSEKP